MVGTFYWHNQFGIWMTALGLLATAWAIGAQGWTRWAASVLAPVAVTSVVLSTSRTDLGLLLVGLVCLLPLAVRSARQLPSALRWSAVPAGSAVLLLVLTSSLFFDRPWSGPAVLLQNASTSSAAGDRGEASIATHGGDRARWTSAALTSWSENPLVGDGFGSFRFTVGENVPPGANTSAFVHDGYAEALASGGLAFGLPLLLLCLLVAVTTLRRYAQSLRRVCPERPILAGASVASGVLLVHAGLDFDWHYPSLVVLLGVVAGLLLGGRAASPSSRPRVVMVAMGSVLMTLLIVTTSLVEHHGRQLTTDGRSYTAAQLLADRWPGTDDPRIDGVALRACLDTQGRLIAPAGVALRAVAASEHAASLDPELKALRELVKATLARSRPAS
ncbi:MAG: O-antigen polymerase [Frankiales bacterium]|nr:O-antigen polymerase [Frankiales bacterium]